METNSRKLIIHSASSFTRQDKRMPTLIIWHGFTGLFFFRKIYMPGHKVGGKLVVIRCSRGITIYLHYTEDQPCWALG